MSKILIALYMGLIPSLGCRSQERNYGIGGQPDSSEGSSSQLGIYNPLPGLGFAQPGNRSLLIKKSKLESHCRH